MTTYYLNLIFYRSQAPEKKYEIREGPFKDAAAASRWLVDFRKEVYIPLCRDKKFSTLMLGVDFRRWNGPMPRGAQMYDHKAIREMLEWHFDPQFENSTAL